MKIPYSILKSFIPNLRQSPEELAELISRKSYEVEDVYNPANNLQNVVVGSIQEIQPHPNADKLQVTKVSVGGGELLTIVCGAKNIEVGQKVPVARVGAILPGGINIKAANLRGQDSFGMLCSARELGLNIDSDGILILPNTAIDGKPIAEALGLDEAIIDIDNKGLGTRASDSSSFYGVAREVALITDNSINALELEPIPIKNKLSRNIKIETKLCHYYSLLELSGLSNYKFDSNVLSKGTYRVDLYVQTDIFRLDSNIHKVLNILNQKPHHPSVDLGNYILFEVGQPVHIFDAEKVEGDILVREAKKGETFVALDGVSIILQDGDIVICDESKIIALAGIIGGESTAVGDGTTNVLIESANFDSTRIRQTARRLKLLTEAAKRFERKIPVELADMAMQRIIHFVTKAGLGVAGYMSMGDNQTHNNPLSISYDYIRKYLGVDISDSDINLHLKSIGVLVHKQFGSNQYKLIPPYWRLDLHTPEEYIEEIARLYGYDNIPAKLDLEPLTVITNPIFDFKRKLSQSLVQIGYIEVINYPYSQAGDLKLINPVDESKPYLRQNLAASLSEAITKNSNYKDTVKLFEISNVFTAEQHLHAGIGFWSKANTANDNVNQAYFDFILAISKLGLDYKKFTTKVADKQNLIIYDAQEIGYLDIQAKVIEIDLSVLVTLLNPITEQYTAIPKYPAVKRDITVNVDAKTSLQEVYDKIRSIVSERCIYLGFRDRFQTNNSIKYTFHLEFRDANKSLSDEEVNTEMSKIEKHFK